jgi:hypothetical protein
MVQAADTESRHGGCIIDTFAYDASSSSYSLLLATAK